MAAVSLSRRGRRVRTIFAARRVKKQSPGLLEAAREVLRFRLARHNHPSPSSSILSNDRTIRGG
jgi:hypothetical protein